MAQQWDSTGGTDASLIGLFHGTPASLALATRKPVLRRRPDIDEFPRCSSAENGISGITMQAPVYVNRKIGPRESRFLSFLPNKDRRC